MGRQTFTQTNWFGGQIAEQRHGNASDEQYAYSAATIENLIVRPTGSLTRRPGTKFVGRTDGNTSLGNEAKAVRLIPFVFGHESANNYVLEFGQEYIKFYKAGAILGGTETGGGSTTHLKITSTPYDTNEKLQDLQFVQSADILFLVSPKVAPYKLSRSTGTTSGWRTSDGFEWTLEAFPYKNGPYLGQQEDSVQGTTNTKITVTDNVTPTLVTTYYFDDSTCATNHTSGLGDPASTSNITMTSTAKVRVGMEVHDTDTTSGDVSGTGLPNGVYVTAVVSSTVITLSASVTATGSSQQFRFKRGEEFINSNFGGNTPEKATNAAYEDFKGNFASLSYFQVKNHGLQEGMKITLSNGNSSGGSSVPRDGTWIVRNPTANTFQMALSATGDAKTFTTDGSADTEAFHAEADTTHDVFAQYYPKGAALTLTASDNIFTDASVGRHFRISLVKKGQIWWVWGKLSNISSDTGQKTATFTLEEDCPATSNMENITAWKFGEWYTDQYPHHVSIFQQRMVFARNSRSPQTVWFSQTADFENFAPSEALGSATGQATATGASIIGDQILATNGMTFTFDSGTIDEIQWMIAQQKLLAGSTGGIYAVYGSEQDLTITPFNFTIKRESTQPAQTGSNAIPYDSNVMFIQGTGKKVRLITYGDISSSATSADITFRATDILQNQAVQVVETDIPNFVSWFRLKDGTIVGVTYIPQQETIAWHIHKIGGDYSYNSTRKGDPTGHLITDKTHAVVLDMCTIPSSTRDQLWLLVRRTIPVADGDKTERIIETVEMMEDWMTTEAISGSSYLDGFAESTAGSTSFAVESATFTASESSGLLITSTSHPLSDGDKIRVSSSGDPVDLPVNLAVDTDYYVRDKTTNNFKLATIPSGGAIAWSDAGTGTHTWVAQKIDATAHGLAVGDILAFTGDDLPQPLVSSTDYYVKAVVSANEFTIATVSATGTEVYFTDKGSGTMTFHRKSLNGLDHLEADSLGILSDGSILDDATITSNGIISLGGKFTTRALAGCKYTSKVISLPISIGPQGRIRVGNKKRIHRTWVKIHRTPNFKYATYTDDYTDADLVELVTRTVANQYGEAPHLASETKELIPKSQGFTDGQFLIQQSDPMPLNILAYEVDFETNDN